MGEEVLLNYEKLFDFLRSERNSVQLQQLPETYYRDVVKYLELKSSSGADQLRNAKKIVEDIYNRREKKILNLAVNKSRTKSSLIDVSALLPEERIMFKQGVIFLDHFREEVLSRTLNAKVPSSEGVPEDAMTEDVVESEKKPVIIPGNKIKVKFLKYVDKFVGPDLEIIGPFDEEDVAELDSEVADLVISKELAEKFGD